MLNAQSWEEMSFKNILGDILVIWAGDWNEETRNKHKINKEQQTTTVKQTDKEINKQRNIE